MDQTPTEISADFLRPLVNGWLGKIESAEKSRSEWLDMATECMDFYAKSARAIWETRAGKRIFRGPMQSKFRMTINKAFEMVAIFGPSLMWDVPHRQVICRRMMELPPDMFGDPNDPQAQFMMQQAQQENAARYQSDKAVASLLMGWLNYTAIESGLGFESEMAVIDALIKGRGCLWVSKYNPPASKQNLTGAERDWPENLLIDPDFNNLNEAKWIARRRVKTIWEVEREFGLKPGSLKGKQTLESKWSVSERATDAGSSSKRSANQTNDLIEYYEIYSKTGVGVRLSGMETKLKDRFEEVVGDYAYLAIAKNVPWPLNCPVEFLKEGAKSEAVKKRFEWPAPYWKDVGDSWPVICLDFFPDPESAWPIPPLAPAMGPLKFLNTMMGHLCNRIWSSSRDFIAVAESAMAQMRQHLESGDDLCIIGVPELQQDITKMITFLQQPEVRLDVWRIIEAVSVIFDKCSGLYEVMYAGNEGGTQNRTAEESRNKAQAAGVRPEYMQKKVVEWQSRLAAVEAFLARWYVNGDDVEPLVGQVGRQMWEQKVMSSDVDTVVRQMQYTVAASSIRRPNKDRDVENMNSFLQSPFMKVIGDYATATGDVEVLNELLQKYGEAIEMDLSTIKLSQPQGPDPEQQKMEMEMQMEQQKLEGEMQLKQMDMQLKQQEMEIEAEMAQIEIAQKEKELEMKAQEGQMKLQMTEQQHAQKMTQQSQEHQLNMKTQALMGAQKVQQSQVEGEAKIEQTKAIGKEKVNAAKAMAKAKPKPKPKAGGKK